MTISKQALREEFRYMQEHYSDPADRARQVIYIAAEALLDELENKQTFQQAFFRQSLMYDVVAEAYEEAKEQIAKDVEIKARLCLESNSLFDRLRAAEKRIAELEAKLETADKLQDGAFRDGLKAGFSYGQTDDQSGFAQCMSAYSTRAGIGVKGE
ncbi:ead/Ea22-like family protein [Salmonella enterica subsp. houtenae]|nr:ead/Ea22-like family protein [Salmonella enterica subsp. houtenae]EEE2294143.1 ead/Ea22-like family protein [Salmonella enterica subsp. houtenae]SUF52983.1 Ead protein [Salmonella enterica]